MTNEPAHQDCASTHETAPAQSEMPRPTIDIAAAYALLRERLPVSPLMRIEGWQTAAGVPIVIKAENLMPTGSFKIRGATYRMATLSTDQRARGVVAYSTGNHARAVAAAARDAGIEATIVMSPDVPQDKLDAVARLGAHIVMAEPFSSSRRVKAEAIACETGKVLIPPYDAVEIIAGQGSIGIELLAQLGSRTPSTVFVPVGGGGLIAGVAKAVKDLSPNVRIVGVEPEVENDASVSFRQKALVTVRAKTPSIADAIRVERLGDLTFPLILEYVDDIVTVSEDEIRSATRRYIDEAHMVVEPGGAVALAAAFRDDQAAIGNGPVVVLACGGNISFERLRTVLS
jgi:threonine dehydratase